MQLRPYQEKQVDFLTSKDNEQKVVGLESPTGSGKSITILEYITHLFNTKRDQTIVITTGSNNLVFEFAQKADEYGLDPIIFIGSSMLTCYETMYNNQIFSLNSSDFCSNVKLRKRIVDKETDKLKICEQCKNCKMPHLREIKELLKEDANKLIITNHQAYLTHVFNEKPYYNPDYVIVDEAHLFSTFYSNWKNTELNSNEIASILNVLGNKPQSKLFQMFLEKGDPLPMQLIVTICDQIKKYFIQDTDKKKYSASLCKKLMEFSYNDKTNEKYFFDIDKNHMRKVVFWSNFDIDQDTIKYRLFTATLDRFTRIMFGMDPDDFTNFYRERNLKLVDYTRSDAYIYKVNNFDEVLEDFIQKCIEKDFKSGLILSTTIENVNNLKNRKMIDKYKVYTSLLEFKEAEGYKVLVGSRALFQGIDIPEINFVLLNKIPFETYDEEFIARTSYLKKYAGIDPWTDYSIPLVKNTLIQTTGRLWRGPEDYGLIGIDDGRLDGRFKYLMSTITDVRGGINLHFVGNSEEPENTEGFDEIISEHIKE